MIYRVMFRFVSLTKDENGQAKELPQSVQDLLPAPITGLKQNDTVAYPLLDKTSVSVADGTWVFTGWPGGTSATITREYPGGRRMATFEAAPKVFSPTMGIMIERQRIDVPAEGPNGSKCKPSGDVPSNYCYSGDGGTLFRGGYSGWCGVLAHSLYGLRITRIPVLRGRLSHSGR